MASSTSDVDPHAVDNSYVCRLDAATEEKAKRELNEDPKDRLNAVKALRTWILQQPHLTCHTDTFALLAFLRTAKFSQLRARELIENNARAITQNPRWLRNINPCEPGPMKVLESGYCLVLPKKDKNGCWVWMFRPAAAVSPNGKLLPLDDQIRANVITAYYTNQNDENTQVNGNVYIIDLTGFTTKHMTQWKIEDLKKWNEAWQKSMPGRFKAFHHYNAGTVFETLMAIMRPFFSKKFQERMYVHDTLESLYKVIDMELLPTEYLPDDYTGPSAGSISDIVDKLKRDISDPSFRRFLLDRSSDRYGLDESKRPAIKAANESFRKLSVD